MLFVLMSTSATAQQWSPESGPDSRAQTVQNKVEQLFERGDYERAYFIYRNELAPAGDKYAQYMVGYMHLMGMGTVEDPVVALAWYRLAAERGTPQFVAVRDQLGRDLQPPERSRANTYYRELRRNYSDIVVLLESVRRDLNELKSRSGSRLGGQSSPMTVVDNRWPVRLRSGADYYGRIRQQLEDNLATLSKLGDFADMETDPDRVDIADLERLVQERLESTPD